MKRSTDIKCYGTCRFANFELTPTGMLKNQSTRCGFDLKPILSATVPASVTLKAESHGAIWPKDYPDCPTYERAI